MAASPIAVYVHVPWCRRVCPYCDFNVKAARTPPERDDVAALRGELSHLAAQPLWAGRRARTLYLGGGTPSLYSPTAVANLVEAVDRAFPLEAGAEVTLEANPGTVDVDRLRGFSSAGVNRLSLGAQSLHAPVLRTLFRDHAPDDVARAVEAARQAGIGNLSLDLIFAVPGQTLAQVEGDVSGFLALAPDHVSAYALTFEPGTPFHRWRERGRLVPADEDVEAAMADAIASRLEAAGLHRYEISSWARPGFESRHNVAYWDGSDYLGLGPGAHSFSASPHPGRRWSNVRDPAAYRTAVRRDGDAVAESHALTAATARADFVWTGLRRVRDGVDLDTFAARFGAAALDVFPQLAELAREGLLELDQTRVRLSARGVRFADAVAAALV